MADTAKQATYKIGGNAIGLGVGNAIAYFGIVYLETSKGVVFGDPLLAMAMGGALVSAALLELRRMGQAVRYVFDRMVPQKYDHDHEDHHPKDD